jgi:hypothetical protein
VQRELEVEVRVSPPEPLGDSLHCRLHVPNADVAVRSHGVGDELQRDGEGRGHGGEEQQRQEPQEHNEGGGATLLLVAMRAHPGGTVASSP